MIRLDIVDPLEKARAAKVLVIAFLVYVLLGASVWLTARRIVGWGSGSVSLSVLRDSSTPSLVLGVVFALYLAKQLEPPKRMWLVPAVVLGVIGAVAIERIWVQS